MELRIHHRPFCMHRTLTLLLACTLTTVLVLFGIKMAIPKIRLDGYSGLLFERTSRGSENTRYAPGYTDDKFLSIRKGMTVEEVHDILGAPIRRYVEDHPIETHYLLYSDSPTSEDYRIRSISIQNDEVVHIRSSYYLD